MRPVPKILAVFALGPFIAGSGWLCFDIARENYEKATQWVPAEATVLDREGSKRITLALRTQDRAWTVTIPHVSTWRHARPGDKVPVITNPRDPEGVWRGSDKELWAGPLLLGLFTLFLLGAAIFLWRVKVELPDRHFDALPIASDEDDEEEDAPFTRPLAPRISGRLTLRAQPAVIKAGYFWAAIATLFTALSAWGLAEGEWAAAPFTAAGATGAVFLLRRSRRLRSLEIRAEAKQIIITQHGRTRVIPLRDLAPFDPADSLARVRNSSGQELFRLDDTLAPAGQVTELRDRLLASTRGA